MAEEKIQEKKLIVVQEVPTTRLREVQTTEGEVLECITIDEALTELVNGMRVLLKKI